MTFAIVGGVFACVTSEILIKAYCSDNTQQMVYYASVWMMSAAVVLATPLAFLNAVKRGLVKTKHLRIISVTAAGIAFSVFALEWDRLPILAYPAILAFAALFILPIATIPLAITWNRHR